MQDILIVIDMQKDFIDGSLGTKEAESIVDDVRAKVEEYKEAGKPIFFTRDTHRENYLETSEGLKLPIKHCIEGTEGHKVDPRVYKPEEYSDPSIYMFSGNKHQFGVLNWYPYFERIAKIVPGFDHKNLKGIEVCGLCTDICVITNALILKTAFPEAEIEVNAKLCAGSTPEKHEEALSIMESCQINVVKEKEEK